MHGGHSTPTHEVDENVAITPISEVTVTVHVPVPLQPTSPEPMETAPSLQPTKVEPVAGFAVSVIMVP